MRNIDQWVAWRAWFPVSTLGGRLVWLRAVERKWNPDINSWGYGGYSGYDGGYEYRLPHINIKESV
jgi:hypothetical protein